MQSSILIIYQNDSYTVNYSKLYNSSNKFREIIQPYLDNGVDPQSLQLRILYDKFDPRNVMNFLKMTQNIKNDVHSNEIAGICEIAKLFQVESLYNKTLTFVRSRIDPNFTVSNDFDESFGTKYLEIENTTSFDLQQTNHTDLVNYVSPPRSKPPNSNNISGNQTESSQPADLHNSCYKIQVLNPLLKCCRYIFSKEGRILFTAKKKANEIYIGKGNDIHIKGDDKNTCCRIMQCDGYNQIYAIDQEFRVNFVQFGQRFQHSIEVSFLHEGKTASWHPRETDMFLSGEYNHIPVQSKKNILLQNQAGVPTFAVRKMGDDLYEVECLSTVNPLTAFSIGLSQIIGPY